MLAASDIDASAGAAPFVRPSYRSSGLNENIIGNEFNKLLLSFQIKFLPHRLAG